jgi:ubiquinone/menaquinone biosynthesis C-methylase UbiE
MKPLNVKSFVNYCSILLQQILTQHVITSDETKTTYDNIDVVDDFNAQSDLQKPEVTVLEQLRCSLSHMKILDIGVGAGRTTAFFARLAEEYIGLDYSANMVTACRRKFPQFNFKVCDARCLNLFKDNYFGFVLFSFNGIDSVNHDDRFKILNEINRVTKKNGYFFFSAHNLNFYVSHVRSIRLSRNPFSSADIVLSFLRSRILNSKIWIELRNPSKSPQNAMIYHYTCNKLMRIYWLTPAEQIKQLLQTGFRNIRVFDLDGIEITNQRSLVLTDRDSWLYYLCQSD